MYNLRRQLESCLSNILQILTYEWDPLQIKDKPDAAQAYEDYAGALCNLLVFQKPLTVIIEYLWEVETRVLGMDGNFTRTEEIAKRLFALAESAYKYSNLEKAKDHAQIEKGSYSAYKQIILQEETELILEKL